MSILWNRIVDTNPELQHIRHKKIKSNSEDNEEFFLNGLTNFPIIKYLDSYTSSLNFTLSLLIYSTIVSYIEIKRIPKIPSSLR